MKFFAILTRIHKWIGLFVGLQIVLWTAGGLVMSVLPLAKVRSEHLIAEPVDDIITDASILSPITAAQKAGLGGLINAKLHRWLGRPVYTVQTPETETEGALVDAYTGELLSPIDATAARKTALADFAGKGEIRTISWVEKGPVEVRFDGPFWRVEFVSPEGYAVWIDPNTANVRAHRSSIWRFYDFFWMLHIMDYGERKNFNSPWLIAFAASAFLFSITGIILLWHRFLLRPKQKVLR